MFTFSNFYNALIVSWIWCIDCIFLLQLKGLTLSCQFHWLGCAFLFRIMGKDIIIFFKNKKILQVFFQICWCGTVWVCAMDGVCFSMFKYGLSSLQKAMMNVSSFFAYFSCFVPKFIIYAFFFVLCFIATPFLTSKVTTFLV